MTVILTWPQLTPATLMTVVAVARSTSEPSDINGLDNYPTEVKYLELPTSQSEVKTHLKKIFKIFNQVQFFK